MVKDLPDGRRKCDSERRAPVDYNERAFGAVVTPWEILPEVGGFLDRICGYSLRLWAANGLCQAEEELRNVNSVESGNRMLTAGNRT